MPSPPLRTHRLRDHLVAAFDKSTLVPQNSERAINVDVEGEYIGTTVRHVLKDKKGRQVVEERNTFVGWKEALSIENLTDFVTEFVTVGQDDVAQEDRWRSKMTKRMSRMVEQGVSNITAQLEEQKALMHMLATKQGVSAAEMAKEERNARLRVREADGKGAVRRRRRRTTTTRGGR